MMTIIWFQNIFITVKGNIFISSPISPHPSPDSYLSTSCFDGFAYPGHFKVKLCNMRPFLSDLPHLAWCFQGLCKSQHSFFMAKCCSVVCICFFFFFWLICLSWPLGRFYFWIIVNNAPMNICAQVCGGDVFLVPLVLYFRAELLDLMIIL